MRPTHGALNLDTRYLPAVLADWLAGRDLPARTRPLVTLAVSSIALVTQGTASRTPPTATLAASLGAIPPSRLEFELGRTPDSPGLYEAQLAGTGSLDPTAATVPLTFRLDAPGNLAPTGVAPRASIDEAKLRDISILLTAKLATVPAP
jgi:hypothetical protein